MPENEMFAKIRNDFLAQTASQENDAEVLRLFCEYATKWLADSGLVGVGHAASGLSLRFSDGSEYLLTPTAANETPIAGTPAFSITGNNGGSIRSAGAMADSSVRVTG